MAMNKNRRFVESCMSILPEGGSYGDIRFLINPKGKLFVEKTCKRDDFVDLAITTKEAFFLQYLNDNEKESFLPKLTMWTEVQKNKCIVYKSLTMQFVGPSLHECNVLGFLINPVWLLHQLMKACHFLERKGVMHLEIKSNNVTYDLDANKIKLIDFGLSEFCLFQDLEKEGGIKKIQQGNQLVVGRVKSNGFVSKYLTPGSALLQSQFFRCQPRVSRISVHTNSPSYRQPETIICQWFGLEKGLQIDAKFDVFSAAWTVLTHMIGAELHVPHYESAMHLERERLGSSLFEILPSLVRYRGGCGSNEVYSLITTVKNVMASLGINLSEQQKRIGQLKAVETILKLGPKEGSLATLSSIYGKSFVDAMRVALHPVKCYRFSSDQVMGKLYEEEKLEGEDGIVECETNVVENRFVICRVKKENFCIASITIDSLLKKIVWSCLSALRQLKKGELIWNEMLIQMHSQCCCMNNMHVKDWYSSIDTKNRFNKT